jgi:hypothetical protein
MTTKLHDFRESFVTFATFVTFVVGDVDLALSNSTYQ